MKLDNWQSKYFDLVFDEFNSSAIKIIKNIIKEKEVDHLYKYRLATKRDLENLENGVLAANAPKNFNDPFELEFSMDFEKIKKEFELEGEYIKYLYPDEVITQELKEKHFLKLHDEIKTKILHDLRKINICCLSSKNNSSLMWSHYADEHRGFCIEYDTLEVCKKHTLICPVKYSDIIPEYPIGKTEFDLKDYAKIIYRKSKCWDYENEWRIVDEYEENVKLLNMPKPTGIYVGCRVEDDVESYIKSFCIKNEIKLHKSREDMLEFYEVIL